MPVVEYHDSLYVYIVRPFGKITPGAKKAQGVVESLYCDLYILYSVFFDFFQNILEKVGNSDRILFPVTYCLSQQGSEQKRQQSHRGKRKRQPRAGSEMPLLPLHHAVKVVDAVDVDIRHGAAGLGVLELGGL